MVIVVQREDLCSCSPSDSDPSQLLMENMRTEQTDNSISHLYPCNSDVLGLGGFDSKRLYFHFGG